MEDKTQQTQIYKSLTSWIITKCHSKQVLNKNGGTVAVNPTAVVLLNSCIFNSPDLDVTQCARSLACVHTLVSMFPIQEEVLCLLKMSNLSPSAIFFGGNLLNTPHPMCNSLPTSFKRTPFIIHFTNPSASRPCLDNCSCLLPVLPSKWQVADINYKQVASSK